MFLWLFDIVAPSRVRGLKPAQGRGHTRGGPVAPSYGVYRGISMGICPLGVDCHISGCVYRGPLTSLTISLMVSRIRLIYGLKYEQSVGSES